jgi:hypothetical protein
MGHASFLAKGQKRNQSPDPPNDRDGHNRPKLEQREIDKRIIADCNRPETILLPNLRGY